MRPRLDNSKRTTRWLTSWLHVSKTKKRNKPLLVMLQLEDRVVLNGPTLANVHLLNDTGIVGDFVTWDPTVAGTVQSYSGLNGVAVEVDHDGDGSPDDRTFPRSDGTWVYAERHRVSGEIEYRFRAIQNSVAGAWSAPIAFTYEYAPNSPAEVTQVGLLRTTGTPGSGITFDPTITGKVVNDGPLVGVRVEFDANNDGDADEFTFVGPDGTFLYVPTKLAEGKASVRVRAQEWNSNTSKFLNGAWSAPVEFTLTQPPAAQVKTLSLERDTGTPNDLVTFDPTVIGTVGPDGAGVTVAFDHNGDGVADGWALTYSMGAFRYHPKDLPTGFVNIRAKYAQWNAVLGGPTVGWWKSLSFTHVTLAPPQVTGFKLANDTGSSPTDNVTDDLTVTGLVIFDDGPGGREVEIDLDGDSVPEAIVVSDGQGRFDYAAHDAAPGPVTIRARTRAWDSATETVLVGGWQAVTFTLTEPFVPMPRVENLALANDTGPDPADKRTTDPTLVGLLTVGIGSAEGLTIEFDHNGDEIPEGYARASETGAFTYLPSELKPGAVAVRARGVVWDGYRGRWAYGEWEDFEFTLEHSVFISATVSGLTLKSDTGPDSSDGKTTDPTLIGAVVPGGGRDVAYVMVEFDENGDGESDGQTFADYQGEFEYTPRTIRPGTVTVQARAVEYDPTLSGYVRSSWTQISFTLELDPTDTGRVPLAGSAFVSAVEAVKAVYNTAAAGAGGRQMGST